MKSDAGHLISAPVVTRAQAYFDTVSSGGAWACLAVLANDTASDMHTCGSTILVK